MTKKLFKKKNAPAAGLLVIFAFLFIGALLLNKSDNKTDSQSTQTNGEITPPTTETPDTTTPTPSGEPFTFTDKSGGKIGSSYFLKDLKFSSETGFDRATISMTQKSGTPHFTARLINNSKEPLYSGNGRQIALSGSYRIEITLDDSRDVDPGTGKNYFVGSGEQSTGGSVITGIKLVYPSDDTKLIVVLELSKKSAFRFSLLSNPSRILIDAQK